MRRFMPDAVFPSRIVVAEREIATILSDLEANAEALVRTIAIDDVDVTQVRDDRPQHLRAVRITLERIPGTRWEK